MICNTVQRFIGLNSKIRNSKGISNEHNRIIEEIMHEYMFMIHAHVRVKHKDEIKFKIFEEN